mmetsp:Transcript_44255/g.137822  ORF Transcript_44255/g.137822 Transcript_44255/m.137822 type:complete len:461 (+) Transcript_44255:70-1452(+)
MSPSWLSLAAVACVPAAVWAAAAAGGAAEECSSAVEASNSRAVSALQQAQQASGGQQSLLPEEEGAAGSSVDSLVSALQGVVSASKKGDTPSDQASAQSEQILSSLRSFAHVVEGDVNSTDSSGNGTHLGGVDRDALSKILMTITQTLFDNLGVTHAADMSSLASAHAELVKCNTAKQSTATGPVSAATNATQAARIRHRESRSSESALATQNASAWAAYLLLETTIKQHACPTYVGSLSAMASFFAAKSNAYISWYLESQKEFDEKNGAFVNSTRALKTKRDEADGFQRSFMNNYCAYKGKQIQMCTTYSSCRADNLAHFRATLSRAKGNEKARKTFFMSGHAIVCHLKVLLRKNKTHDDCKDEVSTYNASGYDVAVPAEPPALSCNTTAATSRGPCDQGFVQEEYGSLPSNVAVLPCSPCLWEASPVLAGVDALVETETAAGTRRTSAPRIGEAPAAV